MANVNRRDLLDLLCVVLLVVEALVMGGIAATYAVYAITADDVQVAATWGIVVFAIIMAVGIGFVARGFARASRWSRGAALTWQILQAAAAVVMLAAVPPVAIGLLVASAIVAAGAMRASARDAASQP